MSKFANVIIDKMELYLKKQVERIEILKKMLGNDYDKHVPSSESLSNSCSYIKDSKLGSNFSNTLGDFKDLMIKYSFDKAFTPHSLFVLDLLDDKDNFVMVFSCKHFLEHPQIQEEAGQPSFICIDATFNLIRGNYKLLVVGKKI